LRSESPKITNGYSYSRAIACCGYLTSIQNVLIYTAHIRKVISRLYFFILRRKITETITGQKFRLTPDCNVLHRFRIKTRFGRN